MGVGEDRKRAWAPTLTCAVIAMPFISSLCTVMIMRAWPQATGENCSLLTSALDVAGSAPLETLPLAAPPRERFVNVPYEIKGPVLWPEVPASMKHDYTMGGRLRVIPSSANVPNANPAPSVSSSFNRSFIQHLVDAAKSNRNICHYQCSRLFFDAFGEFPLRGKSVVILGSMLPWAEAHCLAAEAGRVTTVDYNNPHFEYPGLRFWKPEELSRSEELFDAAISYSSFEHDGLGRYGDPLHPFADLLRMRQLRNILKPDGRLFLGVPVGNDTLVFNWHRIYGPIRFPKFIEGWNLVKTFGVNMTQAWISNTIAAYHLQPLHVLTLDHSWVPTPLDSYS